MLLGQPSSQLPVYICTPGWSEETFTLRPETGSDKNCDILYLTIPVVDHIAMIIPFTIF